MDVGDFGMNTSIAPFDEYDDSDRIGESGGFVCAWVCITVWLGTDLTLSSSDMISIILVVACQKGRIGIGEVVCNELMHSPDLTANSFNSYINLVEETEPMPVVLRFL
jgi:hypothetical protein